MCIRDSFSVVVISSSFHPEFMSAASEQEVPGYPPADVPELRNALQQVHSDLETSYPDQFTGRRALMGVSMGAYHTLYLASEQDSAESKGLGFDRFIAVNPPVSLQYGASRLDKLYSAVNNWPEEEREGRIVKTLQKASSLTDPGMKIEAGRGFPFDLEESKYLIGLQYRLILRSVIHDSQKRHDLEVLQTEINGWQPTASYREISDYSWMEYFYAFVYPSFSAKDSKLEKAKDFFDRGDLRSLESGLRRNKAAYVFTTNNDFLLSEDDHAWLGSTFEKRLTVFEGGGHTGNLHKKEVQDRIFSALEGMQVSGEVTSR